MIYYATAEGVRAYENVPAINQSSLKKLTGDHDPMFFRESEPELFYEEKDWQIIGNGVDTYLSQQKSGFNQQFYMIPGTTPKPSDKLMSILHQLYAEVSDSPVLPPRDYNYYKQNLTPIFNEQDYYPNRWKSPDNWESDTRINELAKEGKCSAYWNALCDAEGRRIISVEEHNLIYTMYHAIQNHPHTAPIFTLAEGSEEYDLVFQFPLYFDFNGIACKGLMDILLVNHKMKKIFPLDFKTSGKYFLFQFPKAIREHRYDFQGAFYTQGLRDKYNIARLEQIINKRLEGYSIELFQLIAISTKMPTLPAVFKLDESLMHIGKYGRPAVVIDGITIEREIHGFQRALELYIYYCNNGFDLNYKFKEGKGRVKVNWEGII